MTANVANPAAAGDGSVRYYLIIDGIDGGSANARFVNSFEISGFSFDIANAVGSGTGGGVGKPTFSPLEIDFSSGDAADEIARTLVRGQHIANARLVGIAGEDTSNPVYDLRLSGTIFSVFQKDASGRDHLGIDYDKFTLTVPNLAGVPETSGWDRQGAKEITQQLPAATPLADGADSSLGATTWYLTIDGLDGGSTAKGHAGAFALTDFQFDMSMSTSIGSGSGGGSGKAMAGPLTASFGFGSAADEILTYVASGRMIGAAQIEGVTKAGGRTVYDLRLNDIAFRDASLDGGATDQLQIEYRKISLTTINTLGTAETMNLDRTSNTSGTTPYAEATPSNENGKAEPGKALYYLTIDGLDGGSTAKGHKGDFEISGFDVDLSNTGNLISGGGGGAGKAKFGPLGITFDAGSDTTKLMDYISRGRHLDSIQITSTEKAGASLIQNGFDLRMADVSLKHFFQSSKGDELTLAYGSYTLTTKGDDGAKETAGWNIAGNKALTTPIKAPEPGDHGGAAAVPDLDYYLVIAGMDGGSRVKQHVGAFAVSGFDFDLTSSTATAGGSGAGKTKFGDLEIDLKLGSAAEELMALAGSGKGIKKIQLIGDAGQGKNSETVYDLRLGNANLDSILDAGRGLDHLSFSYKQFSLATLNADDKRSVYGFDVARNTVLKGELDAAGKTATDGTAAANLHYYMTIGGLDGGSTADKHAHTFELDDLHFNFARAAKTGTLTVNLDIGNAGDELLGLISKGTRSTSVEIIGDRAGEQQGDNPYDLRLNGVTLTKLHQDADGNDVIGMQFSKFTLTTEDGNGQKHTAGYDLAKGVAIEKAITAAKSVADLGSAGKNEGYHLILDGLDGGDRHTTRLGAFDIDDFNFNITAAATQGGGGGAGKTVFKPIEITFDAGASADELLLLIAKGTTIDAGQIVGDIDGQRTVRAFDLRLADVHLSDFRQGDDGDFITLTFDALSLTTLNQSETGATRKETFAFDITHGIGSDQPLPEPVPEF